MKQEHLNDQSTLPRLLRVDRACQILDVSKARFYELVNSGALSTYRIGPRGVRVSAAELERFLDENKDVRR